MTETATPVLFGVPVCLTHGLRKVAAGLPDHRGYSGFAGSSGNWYLICCDCRQRTHQVKVPVPVAFSSDFASYVYTSLFEMGLITPMWDALSPEERDRWQATADFYREEAKRGGWTANSGDKS